LTLHQLKLLGIIHSKSLEIELYLKNQLIDNTNTTDYGIILKPEKGVETPTILLSPPSEVKENLPETQEIGVLAEKPRFSKDVLDLFGPEGESHEYSKVKVTKKNSYSSLKQHHFGQSSKDLEPVVRISAELLDDSDNGDSVKTVDSKSQSSDHKPNSTAKVTFKIARDRPSEYPKIDSLTFIDPTIADFLQDWELYSPDESLDNIDLNNLSADRPKLMVPESTERSSIHSSKSGQSSHPEVLPRELLYKCPPFRAIPKWFPISRLPFAYGLLFFTVAMTVINLAINTLFTVMA
jgi:hypothetical protein